MRLVRRPVRIGEQGLPLETSKKSMVSVDLRKTNAMSWNYPELLEYALSVRRLEAEGSPAPDSTWLSDDLNVKAPA
jgi:hypothetical protein